MQHHLPLVHSNVASRRCNGMIGFSIVLIRHHVDPNAAVTETNAICQSIHGAKRHARSAEQKSSAKQKTCTAKWQNKLASDRMKTGMNQVETVGVVGSRVKRSYRRGPFGSQRRLIFVGSERAFFSGECSSED
ncbi:hypothetical protein LF1_38150 [Rubripirellula obstinata]|uniref:Uncharacterized protein n=1 Tax=Rubripirellula obstinata TaxID=406547 RepID=A0A5B1CNA4_9BACT|nr:hypothetical protein LF1_38150 [Rubripirellula obstinata]